MKKISQIISILILVALLLWGGLYLKNHFFEFKTTLVSIPPISVISIIVAAFFFYIFQGLILKTLLKPFGIKLSFIEWFGLSAATTLGNYIFPFAGLGLRGAYLKKNKNLAYADFLSLSGGAYLIEMVVYSFGGIISLLAGFHFQQAIDLKLLILLVLIVIFSLCLILIPRLPRLNKISRPLDEKLQLVFKGFQKIKDNRKILFELFYLTFGGFIFFTAMFFFAYRSINIDLSFIQSIQPSVLSDFVYIIRLLPASVGFYEGAILYFNHTFGLNVSQGLIISVLTRFGLIFWAFSLGLIFSLIFIFNKSFNKGKNV